MTRNLLKIELEVTSPATRSIYAVFPPQMNIHPLEYQLQPNPLWLLTSALLRTQNMKGAISPLVTTSSWKTVAST